MSLSRRLIIILIIINTNITDIIKKIAYLLVERNSKQLSLELYECWNATEYHTKLSN